MLRNAVQFGGFKGLKESMRRLRKKWGVCAVVGSSGVLRKHHHGAAIDASDLVIRFNNAPTGRFAPMVGKRDDVRFWNQQMPGIVMDWPMEDFTLGVNTTFVIIPMDEPVKLHEFRRLHPRSEVYLLDESMHESLSRALRAVYEQAWFRAGESEGVSFIPTSGAVGMMYAMAMCNEVRAYGMAATPDAAHAPYHYYESKGRADDQDWHKTFDSEKDLWRRLASNSDDDIDATDVAVIPGFSRIPCHEKRSG